MAAIIIPTEVTIPMDIGDAAIFTAGIVVAMRFGWSFLRDISGKTPALPSNGMSRDQASEIQKLLADIRDQLRSWHTETEEVRREDVKHVLITEQTHMILAKMADRVIVCPLVPTGAESQRSSTEDPNGRTTR